jgi:ribonuclease HI/probable phosphoglycerate mutase
MKETITVNFDGGSRGNPGPSGIGVVLSAEDGTPLITIGKYIGAATNNVAEYMALIQGLEEAAKLGAEKVLIRGDSELIIKQMRGEYRVKNPALKDLFEKAHQLVRTFKSVTFEHNLREKNVLADKLVNLAIDRQGDVEDADDTMPSAAPSQSKRPERLHCENCGCRIEVIKPSRSNTGEFICMCGFPMK